MKKQIVLCELLSKYYKTEFIANKLGISNWSFRAYRKGIRKMSLDDYERLFELGKTLLNELETDKVKECSIC